MCIRSIPVSVIAADAARIRTTALLDLPFTAGHVRDFLPQCRLSGYFGKASGKVYRKLVIFSGRRIGKYRHYFVVVTKRVQNIFSRA